MNYFYMNDFPLSIAKGGKETQLRFVANVAKGIFDNVFNLQDENAPSPKKGDIIHFFGDSPIFYYTIKLLEGSGVKAKYIISPNFYRQKSSFYKILRFLPKQVPNWYSERKLMYESVDSIIVNSKLEKRYLISIFGTQISDRISVIYNTFDQKPKTTTRNTPSLDNKYPYYLMVSHLNRRKNIFNLLLASDKIYQKHNLRLVIVGGLRFFDSKDKVNFLKMVEEREWVDYLGEKDKGEVVNLMVNSEFHILPSFIESPGISNLEAISLGKKIIVGDFPILHEYFSKNTIFTGFKAKQIERSVDKILSVKSEPVDLSFCSAKTIASKYKNLLLNELY